MNTDNQPKVKFSKEFITPSGLKEWIGTEWPVGLEVDRDAIFSTLNQVRDAVLDWHQQNNTNPTHLDLGYGPQVVQWNIDRGNPKDALVADINSCADIKVLESYKLLVKNDPDLQAAYEKKFAELKK